MKVFLNILKVTAWVVVTFFLGLIYIALFKGFLDAIDRGDLLNILTIPSFIGLFATVHYLLLSLLNYFAYSDHSFAMQYLPLLKKQGLKRALLICVPLILLGVASVAVIFAHLYFTLVVFGILTPKDKKYSYIPSPYKPAATTSTTTTTANTSTTTASTTTPTTDTITTTTTPTVETDIGPKDYDFDSYRRYIQSNLNASSIRVDFGYSRFVRSAKVTSLSLSFSGGSTPSVRASATVTVYVNSAAARSYIGTNSHSNSSAANSTVVDSEIKSSISRAKDSTTSAIEDRIRQLTRNFAAANGSGPDSVRESASVSVQKVN